MRSSHFEKIVRDERNHKVRLGSSGFFKNTYVYKFRGVSVRNVAEYHHIYLYLAVILSGRPFYLFVIYLFIIMELY